MNISPLKTILKTSLPAVIDLASQTIMWTIEAILIGKISAGALAGHSMAIQVILVFFAILLTFVVGASLIINRHLGAKEYYQANHIFGQAMMLGVIMAIIFPLIWYFGAVHLFKFIKEAGEASAQAAGVTYMRTVAIFAPLFISSFIALGIMRAVGDTRYSMIVNLSINGLNLVLAPLLIFGLFGLPRLEVKGAALAIGISHSVGFVVTLILLRSHRCQLFLSFREMAVPNWQSFKQLFKVGLPTTIEQLTWAIGQLVVTSYAGSIYVTVLTTHAIFMRIQAILSMVYMGFSLAAMSNMGKNLGAEDNVLAEKMARTAHWVMAIFVMFIVLVMIFFSRAMIQVFTTDPATVALGSKAMIVFALAQIPKAMNNVLAGNLRGIGELQWLMWTTIIFVIIFEIGINYWVVFGLGWSIYGLWAVQFTDESIRFSMSYIRFHRGSWRVKKS